MIVVAAAAVGIAGIAAGGTILTAAAINWAYQEGR